MKIDLTQIPHEPGCYIFKSAKGIILYIGKAKDLRKRVNSYFQKKDHDPKTKILVSRIKDFDFIVTKTEVEALLLENNLIKKHQPKYNIDLKDSKRYAYLEITKGPFSMLRIVRQKKEKGEYYGPFTSAETRDYIKDSLIKTFKLRTCSKLPKKVCLRYHIGICSAPCENKISSQDYVSDVQSVRTILRGDYKNLIKKLASDMKKSASKENFESALVYRNQIDALTYLEEKQNVQRNKEYNEDIINFIIQENIVYLTLFHITKGILLDKEEFTFDLQKDFLEKFITRYYDERVIPKELILPISLPLVVEEYLTLKKGSKVRIIKPLKGEKKQLLDFVKNNISATYFANEDSLKELQKAINLQDVPRVIECFDISHISGTSTVASMVQFRNGKPVNNNYRRFKIRTVDGNDDFASMAEVVTRRYIKLKLNKESFPNLIVIDGGKGQLSAAIAALDHIGVKIPIISLAKKEEEIFVPQSSDSIILSKKNAGLQLLQRARDEAHRFAITYNRLLRKKKLLDE